MDHIPIPTIKLKNKEDGREALFNVDHARELCEQDWEVVAPEGDEAQVEIINQLDAGEKTENADQLDAEEVNGDKETPETLETPETSEVPEVADNKPEVIPPETEAAE